MLQIIIETNLEQVVGTAPRKTVPCTVWLYDGPCVTECVDEDPSKLSFLEAQDDSLVCIENVDVWSLPYDAFRTIQDKCFRLLFCPDESRIGRKAIWELTKVLVGTKTEFKLFETCDH